MTVTLDDLRAPLTIAFSQRVAQTVKVQPKGVVLYATKNTALETDYRVDIFDSALNITNVPEGIKLQIKRCFLGNPKEVILLQYKTSFESVSETAKNQKFNWLCCDIIEDQADVKTFGIENKKFTVVYNQAADNMNIVNFVNPIVTLNDESTTELTGVEYLPRLCGALAGLPYNMSMSAVVFNDLKKVTMPESSSIGYGQFILENEEDGVRVVAPVNSLVTLASDKTEDMKSIAVVEGMKRYEDDLRVVFKEKYKGHYKNHYKNQTLFYAAAKQYLKDLEDLEILDSGYDNNIGTAVEKQRQAWLGAGKEEAKDWSDEEVKLNTFKNKMIIKSDVKFLDAIEGMEIYTEMF